MLSLLAKNSRTSAEGVGFTRNTSQRSAALSEDNRLLRCCPSPDSSTTNITGLGFRERGWFETSICWEGKGKCLWEVDGVNGEEYDNEEGKQEDPEKDDGKEEGGDIVWPSDERQDDMGTADEAAMGGDNNADAGSCGKEEWQFEFGCLETEEWVEVSW